MSERLHWEDLQHTTAYCHRTIKPPQDPDVYPICAKRPDGPDLCTAAGEDWAAGSLAPYVQWPAGMEFMLRAPNSEQPDIRYECNLDIPNEPTDGDLPPVLNFKLWSKPIEWASPHSGATVCEKAELTTDLPDSRQCLHKMVKFGGDHPEQQNPEDIEWVVWRFQDGNVFKCDGAPQSGKQLCSRLDGSTMFFDPVYPPGEHTPPDPLFGDMTFGKEINRLNSRESEWGTNRFEMQDNSDLTWTIVAPDPRSDPRLAGCARLMVENCSNAANAFDCTHCMSGVAQHCDNERAAAEWCLEGGQPRKAYFPVGSRSPSQRPLDDLIMT